MVDMQTTKTEANSLEVSPEVWKFLESWCKGEFSSGASIDWKSSTISDSIPGRLVIYNPLQVTVEGEPKSLIATVQITGTECSVSYLDISPYIKES